jgi:hypothetical protein
MQANGATVDKLESTLTSFRYTLELVLPELAVLEEQHGLTGRQVVHGTGVGLRQTAAVVRPSPRQVE